MWEGKVSAAPKFPSKNYDNDELKLDKNIFEELKFKHPDPAEVKEDFLLHEPKNKVPNCYFNDIDEDMVGRAGSLTKGCGSPSHVDSTFRLIPLNKDLGFEVLRRVISKPRNWVLEDDMQEAAGYLQTAAGLKAGAKAAIHAM